MDNHIKNDINIIDDLTKFYCQKENQNKEKYIKILILIVLVFIVTIIIGSIIFMFDLTWIDAFYVSSLILTGIELEVVPITFGQKLFIIFYALFSILILLSMANLAVQYFFICLIIKSLMTLIKKIF